MNDEQMTTTAIVTALLSDVASAIGIPGGATVSELVREHLQRKQTEAFNLLVEELRKGEVTVAEVGARSEFISCLWRYSRAAIEGSARANLRLLARTFAGLAHSETMYAEKFKRFADILSDLSAEEILVLATLQQICANFGSRETYYASKSMQRLVARLVPGKFSTEIHLHGVLAGLSRTGLISQGAGTMDDIGGWMTTPLMDEVAVLAKLEEELA